MVAVQVREAHGCDSRRIHLRLFHVFQQMTALVGSQSSIEEHLVCGVNRHVGVDGRAGGARRHQGGEQTVVVGAAEELGRHLIRHIHPSENQRFVAVAEQRNAILFFNDDGGFLQGVRFLGIVCFLWGAILARGNQQQHHGGQQVEGGFHWGVVFGCKGTIFLV